MNLLKRIAQAVNPDEDGKSDKLERILAICGALVPKLRTTATAEECASVLNAALASEDVIFEPTKFGVYMGRGNPISGHVRNFQGRVQISIQYEVDLDKDFKNSFKTKRFMSELGDILHHELVHVEQINNNKGILPWPEKYSGLAEYMGHPTELEAHAATIARVGVRKLGTDKFRQLLGKQEQYYKIPVLREYFEVVSSQTFQKLLSLIEKHL